jgi:HrpA-like RNA helicase
LTHETITHTRTHSVPDIRHVVDSGLTQLHFFDPSTGLERWITTAVSQASACQRAGRGGRLQSGKCYRLYTEPHFASLPLQTPPEVVRTNLTQLILTLKALGVDNVLAFDLMSIPPVESLSHGLETLYALGAIDEQTHLTSLGRDLSCFPVEPRIARMLLKSLELHCSWDVLSVASALLVMSSDRGGQSSSSPLLWMAPPSASRSHQKFLDYQASMAELMDPSGDHVTYVNILGS